MSTIKKKLINQVKRLEVLLAEAKKDLEHLPPEPVFPSEGTLYCLLSDGEVSLPIIEPDKQVFKDTAMMGNTFYSEESAEKELTRRKAYARIVERIALENEGSQETIRPMFFSKKLGLDALMVEESLRDAAPFELRLANYANAISLTNNTQFVKDYLTYLGVPHE